MLLSLRALAALFLLMAWLLPVGTVPWLSFSKEVCAFISVFLWALSLRAGKFRLQLTWFVMWPGLLLVAVAGYYFFGVNIYISDTVLFCLYLGLFLCCYVFAFSLQKQGVDVLLIGAKLLVVGGLFSFLFVCWQWFLGGDSLWVNSVPASSRLIANFGQSNNLATFFLLASLASMLLYQRRVLSLISFVVLMMLFFWGVGLTQSRTACLSVLVVFVWWCLKARGTVFPARYKELSIGVVLFYLMFFVAGQMIGGAESVAHYSRFERLPAWVQLFKGLNLWGYGWGQVGLAQAEIVLEQGYGTIFLMNAHNIVLDFLLWGGWLGACFVAAFFAWFARGLFSDFDENQWFYTAMLAVLFVHAFLELPLEYAYFLVIFAALLGGYDAVRGVMARDGSWWLMFAFLLFLFGFGALVVKEYLDVERDTRAMRFQMAYFQGAERDLFEYESVLLDGARDYLLTARLSIGADMSDEDVQAVSRAARRYPYVSVLQRNIEVLSYMKDCDRMRSEQNKLYLLHRVRSMQQCGK